MKPPSAIGRRIAAGAGVRVWLVRGLGAAAVLAFLGATRALEADPIARADLQYRWVLPFGYGHLLGALWFSRRRLASALPAYAPRLFAAFLAVSIATLFAIYAWALAAGPLLALLPLLAVSTWHTAENDLALADAHRRGLALGAVPRARDVQLAAIGVALGVALAAATAGGELAARWAVLPGQGFAVLALRAAGLATGAALLSRGGTSAPRVLGGSLVLASALVRRSGLGLSDVVAGATLYHLATWLVYSLEKLWAVRRTDPFRARSQARQLAAVHAVPVLVCVAAYSSPFEALASALAAPAVYLFGSVLHVAQTAWLRGLAPPVAA